MTINPQNIKYALAKTLPGVTSHQKMLPLNRRIDVGKNEKGKIKHSSVLLLIYPENEDIHVLLIKRPKHMKHHAGQIALPGGRIEKGA